MSLFDKKVKGESVKVLSEKDIQNKLYGKYRTNSDTTFAPVVITPKSVQVQSPKPGKGPVPANEDLFSALRGEPKTESPSISKPEVPQEHSIKFTDNTSKPKEVSAREPIGKWVKDENTAGVSATLSFKKDEKSQVKRVSVAPQKNDSQWLPMLATVSKSTSAVFHGLIGFFAGLVRNLVNLLLRFLSGIDLSNPRVRQAVYWISVGGVMTLIFFGIHFLNDKREVAMKIPPKVTHSAAVRKVVVPAPVIPKPEPKTENVQSAETDNRAAQGAEESREAATVAETSIAAKAFVVQVATYVNEDDAKAVIDRFRRASFSAVVKVQRRSEGKHFYSVFLGPYESYRKAQEDLAKFKKNDVSKPFQDAFIRSMAQ